MEDSLDNQGWSVKQVFKFFFVYYIYKFILQIPLEITNFTSLFFYPIFDILIFCAIIKKIYLDKNNSIKIDKIPTFIGYISIIFLVFSFRFVYDNSIALLLEKYITFDFIDIEKSYLPLFASPVRFFLSAVIVAPIVEEVIYREIILNKLLGKYSSIFAIIISSLLFSVIHLSIFSMINALFLGMIFGYLYTMYKSLVFCIVLHSAANMLVFIQIFILKIDITNISYGNNIISDNYINLFIGWFWGYLL